MKRNSISVFFMSLFLILGVDSYSQKMVDWLTDEEVNHYTLKGLGNELKAWKKANHNKKTRTGYLAIKDGYDYEVIDHYKTITIKCHNNEEYVDFRNVYGYVQGGHIDVFQDFTRRYAYYRIAGQDVTYYTPKNNELSPERATKLLRQLMAYSAERDPVTMKLEVITSYETSTGYPKLTDIPRPYMELRWEEDGFAKLLVLYDYWRLAEYASWGIERFSDFAENERVAMFAARLFGDDQNLVVRVMGTDRWQYTHHFKYSPEGKLQELEILKGLPSNDARLLMANLEKEIGSDELDIEKVIEINSYEEKMVMRITFQGSGGRTLYVKEFSGDMDVGEYAEHIFNMFRIPVYESK